MQKHLSIFTTAAIVYVGLVAATASAAPISASASANKLIVKDEKAKITQTNVTPADLKSIRQTLTQFYRGLNEGSVARIAKVAPLTSNDRHEFEVLFSRIKSVGGDWSIEVTNIELVSFSDRNAFMRVDELHKISAYGRVANTPASTSIRLSKLNGRWQVTDLSSVLRSLDRN